MAIEKAKEPRRELYLIVGANDIMGGGKLET
jgi:hypothetical protein